MSQKNELNYTAIIVAVIIAGALIYVGMQLNKANLTGNSSSKSFEEQLAEYNAKQQEEQLNAQKEAEKQRQEAAKNVKEIAKGDHVQGPRDAEITIYEYSDFECPYCKRFYKTPGKIVSDNAGKVNTVYRHFPLGFHDPLATMEATAAECAAAQGGDKAFYEYHDAIFDATNSNGKGLDPEQLPVIAQKLGLNKAQFEACLASDKYKDLVKENQASGADAGITGTPGVIVKNNKTGEVRVMPGAVPPETVQAAVDELLGN